MNLQRIKYLTNYRNPCWFQSEEPIRHCYLCDVTRQAPAMSSILFRRWLPQMWIIRSFRETRRLSFDCSRKKQRKSLLEKWFKNQKRWVCFKGDLNWYIKYDLSFLDTFPDNYASDFTPALRKIENVVVDGFHPVVACEVSPAANAAIMIFLAMAAHFYETFCKPQKAGDFILWQ